MSQTTYVQDRPAPPARSPISPPAVVQAQRALVVLTGLIRQQQASAQRQASNRGCAGRAGHPSTLAGRELPPDASWRAQAYYYYSNGDYGSPYIATARLDVAVSVAMKTPAGRASNAPSSGA